TSGRTAASCCEVPARDTPRHTEAGASPRTRNPQHAQAMRVEIITIGDELLLGLTVDTNAVWLARELAARGISVVHRTTVGDDTHAITTAVRDAGARTGAVITTGGL